MIPSVVVGTLDTPDSQSTTLSWLCSTAHYQLCVLCRRPYTPAEGVGLYLARPQTTAGTAFTVPPVTVTPTTHSLGQHVCRPWRAMGCACYSMVCREHLHGRPRDMVVAGASNTTSAPSHLGPPQSRIPLTHHPRAAAGSPRWSQGGAMVMRAMPAWAPPSKRDHMHHWQGMATTASIVT